MAASTSASGAVYGYDASRQVALLLHVGSASDVARATDEIENFLVNLSTSQTCARPEEIRRMERFIEREQLLLRINLLQSELSGE